jgi:hypothetical protein
MSGIGLAVGVTVVTFVAFVALAYWRRWQWTGLPSATALDGGREDPAREDPVGLASAPRDPLSLGGTRLLC